MDTLNLSPTLPALIATILIVLLSNYVLVRRISAAIIVIDKRLSGWVLVAVDISDRVKVLEALRESEERYRILADNSNNVIWNMEWCSCPTPA